MKAWPLRELLARHAEAGELYHEFLRADSMSLGLYRLPAGGTDRQSPHAEDEAYLVLAGRATIEVEGQRRPVQTGSVIFVEKDADHRFVDVEEDLDLLVFFAPPEGT